MEIRLKLTKSLQDFALLVSDLIEDCQHYRSKLPFVSASNYHWPQFQLNAPDSNVLLKFVEVIFQQEGASGIVTARAVSNSGTELIVSAYDDEWQTKLKKAWEHLYYELYSKGDWLETPPAPTIYPPWWPDNPVVTFDDIVAGRPEQIKDWLMRAISRRAVDLAWENWENWFHIERLTPIILRTLDVYGEGAMRPAEGVPFPSWDCLLFSFELCPLADGQHCRVRSICAPDLPLEAKEYLEELRRVMVEELGWGDGQCGREVPAQQVEFSGQRDGLSWSWAGTQTKLANLRAIREQAKANGKGNRRVTVGRIAACIQAEIDPKTVRKRAPELWVRWDDWEY
jgi:hypothetical protein